MTEVRVRRSLERGRVSLLHPGLGRGWWWPDRPVVADARRVWFLGRGSAVVMPLAGVEQVGRDERGAIAVAGARWVRDDGAAGEVGRERAVPGGEARVWVSDGFVYRADAGRTVAIDVVYPGETVSVGPYGAVAIDGAAGTRAGAPGRSPRPLAVRLGDGPIRWSADGRVVAGLDVDGAGVVVDLGTGAIEARSGAPVAVDAWHRGSAVVRGAR
ncbi:MAG: hypothetical protein ABMB14_33715, partial [Myxococcota bacterium]